MTIMNTSYRVVLFRHVNNIMCVIVPVHLYYAMFMRLQHGLCEKKWKTARNAFIYNVDRRTHTIDTHHQSI